MRIQTPYHPKWVLSIDTNPRPRDEVFVLGLAGFYVAIDRTFKGYVFSYGKLDA